MITKLPEYWCVKSTPCATPNEYFLTYKDNSITDFVTGDYRGWWFTSEKDSVGNYARYERDIPDNYVKLTLDEFKFLVLREVNQYEIY